MVEPTPEDDRDIKAFPIDEEAELNHLVAKGPFGEEVSWLQGGALTASAHQVLCVMTNHSAAWQRNPQ